MYYVIETEFVGPNQREKVDTDYLEISSEPATKNGNGAPCVFGWCGTTNDWSETAHGEFDTLEDAEKYISENWETREWEDGRDLPGERTVKAYKVGKFAPMSYEACVEWLYNVGKDLTADTTDEKLQALAEEEREVCESEHGYSLDYAELVLSEYREEKRDEKRRKELEGGE